MSFVDDFLQGQKDCADGIPHEPGMSADYDRGYADEYEMSAKIDERTKND